MSVKSQIERLSLQERRQLAHAFDQGFSQFIEFGNDEFIAVHLNPRQAKHLQIIEKTGVWSYGHIKR